MKRNKVSRREFLKGAGAVVGGAAVGTSLLGMAAYDQSAAGAPAAAPGNAFGSDPDPTAVPAVWDFETDVVVIGGGAVGIATAIRIRDAGASVLVVDCNYDIGGHAIISGGNVPLGGGTAHQKKYGIQDDPETYFRDLVDWTVVMPGGIPEYRYNDPALQRVIAYTAVETYDFLVANGVEFSDTPPDNRGANSVGVSARREHHTIWTQGQGPEAPLGNGGASLMRSLEKSARAKGVQFILNYHMDVIYREKVYSGRVLGIKARYTPTILPGSTTPMKSLNSQGNIERTQPTITLKARKSVVIATGGNSGNVDFRRIFDVRLTEETCHGGWEWSPQDASGELAAMALGASLWGTANQTQDRGHYLSKRPLVGSRTNYWGCTPASPVFPKIKYQGLAVRTFQDMITVNQTGKRFYNEMDTGYYVGSCEGHYDKVGGYVQNDWRNTTKLPYAPKNWVDAALAPNEGSQPPYYAAGPIWGIFDSDAVTREQWEFPFPAHMVDPDVFFSANTLRELADKINTSSWTKYRMPANVLEETVRRYNSFVDSGVDSDFDKPRPQYKIEKGPFYAGWVPIFTHDSYAGLRINEKCQVQNTRGQIIPGLFCGGESAGGCGQHGLARCFVQAYVIGKECLV